MILFLSEWTGKVAPTTSTSDALIIFLKGALGRVFCSGRFFLKPCLVLMIQSQEWNSSSWQEDRDAHICPNCVSLTLADGYFKTSKEKKTCQTTVLYHGIFRCPFFTSGVVCFWWFYLLWWSSNDNDYRFFFQATNVLDRCVFGCVWIICLGT